MHLKKSLNCTFRFPFPLFDLFNLWKVKFWVKTNKYWGVGQLTN